ncbi:2-succinyl-5-enolpyruvyl-6-hydroxy-3-cyclohexene-1-carboxylic-acid synthase [Gleimia hominis]|uniref:2-succinyl-5-enolpyruvyl-6-hydroxy-3-cyclohexene-1-carboxylate synthase n=1 Tax=Gleimia hominis TaxID=595468 RepID=A0ABU3I9N9_9ACTO|nr:2-succinyl-5-enolpyruvyl-6-hydroxy-3-cyclohexene-1-carboxylic-acid synthase [Gleimia hominis]MDT3767089.1 2-succinyl-5-enolpyruvyl-6-hydroxy-3-cyclohexene-1-carboxylic-acid synthase [Gleimia hominis]
MVAAVEVARQIVKTLLELGVRDWVVCPGSRNAPLLYALAEAEAEAETEAAISVEASAATGADPIRVYPEIDERSAGFFALGLGRASGKAAAVVTTSGTAPAHLLPAVVEASHSHVPLVVISADRPWDWHGVGASQTTDQTALFTPFAPGLNIPDQMVEGPQWRRGLVNQIVHKAARAVNMPGGPVHINVAFREPLVPPLASPRVAVDSVRIPEVHAAQSKPAAWEEVVDPSLRTVVVAGNGDDGASVAYASATGYPLLAEPSAPAFGSSWWTPHQQEMLRRYSSEVQQVVLVGTPTISRPVSALLSRSDVRIIVVAEGSEWPDVRGYADVVVPRLAPPCKPGDVAGVPGEPRGINEGERKEDAGVPEKVTAWAQQWKQRAAALRTTGVPDAARAAQLVWRAFAQGVPEHALVLGASNAIRYVDLLAKEPAGVEQSCVETGKRRVYTNRGQAGIDGTVAFAKGVHAALGVPVRVLLGDVTFLHDASSLRQSQDCAQLDIVVLDDAGGRIFESLEHGQAASKEMYERYFAQKQNVDYEALAHAYGYSYRHVEMSKMADAPGGKLGELKTSSGVELKTLRDDEAFLKMLTAPFEGGRIVHVVCNPHGAAQALREMFTK